MIKLITNHDIPVWILDEYFTRKELRQIAKDNKIKQGRDKGDVIYHITHGTSINSHDPNDEIITFYIKLEII